MVWPKVEGGQRTEVRGRSPWTSIRCVSASSDESGVGEGGILLVI